jgi:hypothetical protein
MTKTSHLRIGQKKWNKRNELKLNGERKISDSDRVQKKSAEVGCGRVKTAVESLRSQVKTIMPPKEVKRINACCKALILFYQKNGIN